MTAAGLFVVAALARPTMLGPGPLPSIVVHVSGPQGPAELLCDAPCEYSDVRTVERVKGRTTITEEAVEGEEIGKRGRDECLGDCDSPERKVIFNLSPGRDLEEGVTVEIADGRAKVIIHDVVRHKGVLTNRRRTAEFDVDRLPIDLEVHDHRIVLSRAAGDV